MEKPINRRSILKNSLFASAAASVAGIAKAQELCTNNALTPAQQEGPFYPVFIHPDLDADLTIVKGKKYRARGEIVDLTVHVQNENCEPIEGALVDLWQACSTGKYDHPDDPNTAAMDPYFQYAAKILTDANGMAKIRTIKPGSYPASDTWIRPPHIHFKISGEGYEELTTQMYFDGEATNAADLYIKALSKADRARLIVPFAVSTVNGKSTAPQGTFLVTLASV